MSGDLSCDTLKAWYKGPTLIQVSLSPNPILYVVFMCNVGAKFVDVIIKILAIYIPLFFGHF